MKGCVFLYNAINFMPTQIQPCCDTFALGVPRFPFRGGYVDMEKYARHIEGVLEDLQNNTDGICKGCEHLTDYKKIPPVFSFRSVTMSPHHHHCNCKCVYCGLWSLKDKVEPYSMLEPLKSLFEQQVIRPDTSFHWGGGESSILKDFEETSKWILEHNHIQYVHTNALKYSPAMGAFLSKGMGYVNISLDSPNADVYYQVKGVKGFDLVVNHIKKYFNTSISPNQVHIKYIIFEKNNSIENIRSFINLMVQLGICHVEFSFDFHEVQKQCVSERSINAAVYFYFLAKQNKMECQSFYVPQDLLDRIIERGNSIVREKK